MSSSQLPTVSIFNTSEDYLDIMRIYLNAEGFVTTTMSITRIKSGEISLVAFLQEHSPQIIMYDIAFPYKENWMQCQNFMNLDECKGREFILTTPNLDALEDQIGKEVGAYELVDKEIDLRKIIAKVKEVWNKLEER